MSMSAMATARSGSAGGGRTWIHPSEVAEMFPELLRTAPVSITAMRILNILPLLGLFAASPLHAQAATPAPGGKGKAIVEKLLRMTPEERRDFLKTHPEIRTVKSSTLRRSSLPAAASARCGRGEREYLGGVFRGGGALRGCDGWIVVGGVIDPDVCNDGTRKFRVLGRECPHQSPVPCARQPILRREVIEAGDPVPRRVEVPDDVGAGEVCGPVTRTEGGLVSMPRQPPDTSV